jgi:hypothetical protein
MEIKIIKMDFKKLIAELKQYLKKLRKSKKSNQYK